jgi:hypothetical protein
MSHESIVTRNVVEAGATTAGAVVGAVGGAIVAGCCTTAVGVTAEPQAGNSMAINASAEATFVKVKRLFIKILLSELTCMKDTM